eukprot:1285523-Prymnesium_polylepis.1
MIRSYVFGYWKALSCVARSPFFSHQKPARGHSRKRHPPPCHARLPNGEATRLSQAGNDSCGFRFGRIPPGLISDRVVGWCAQLFGHKARLTAKAASTCLSTQAHASLVCSQLSIRTAGSALYSFFPVAAWQQPALPPADNRERQFWM